MAKFKITAEQWKLVKEVAYRAANEDDMPSRNHVKLDCRLHCLALAPDGDTHLNGAIVSKADGSEGYHDLDLADYGAHFTEQFRAGVELTDDGRGYFDFYVYNRYDRGGDLHGNVMIYVTGGRISAIDTILWYHVSWTPEGGIVRHASVR